MATTKNARIVMFFEIDGALKFYFTTTIDHEFYTEQLIWELGRRSYIHHPSGYHYIMSPQTGAVGWQHAQSHEVVIRETEALW